jgi:transcriptional regulator with XRE-family HTH domain
MQPTEAERILELLEALIVLRKFRLRDLEQSLGMSAGTLRRILNGRIELKFRHITDILALLDMPTRTFFKIAYEADDLAEAQSQLARAHRIAHAEPKPITLTPGELEAVVVATIERLGLSVHPPEERHNREKVAQKPNSARKKKAAPRRARKKLS